MSVLAKPEFLSHSNQGKEQEESRASGIEVNVAAKYGSQSMVQPLRTVLVRRPDGTFGEADPKTWGYTAKPNLSTAQGEHDRLVDLLRESGTEIWYHDEPESSLADAIFVHDPIIVTDRGAVVLRMGKELRRGEPPLIAKTLESRGVPILGALRAPATAEGGDLLWVNHDLLAVGQGFRTNAEGLRQLDELMKEIRVQTMPVALPYHNGPAACLHLMSLISLVDEDLVVVYPRLLPVPFWRSLKEEGFDFIEVPETEFDRMGPNVLAVAPRDCIALEGSPITRQRLEDAGCRVRTYQGDEISLKAEGGATCLTRPVYRSR